MNNYLVKGIIGIFFCGQSTVKLPAGRICFDAFKNDRNTIKPFNFGRSWSLRCLHLELDSVRI